MTPEQEDSELARTVTRLGDSTDQLTNVLRKVDDNQKALLKLRLEVDHDRELAAINKVKVNTENQLAKSRNKTAVLVLIIMIVTSVFGLVSYTKTRANANEEMTALQQTYLKNSKCQIDFNTKVLAVLKGRGMLDGEDQKNLIVLLEQIAIPGSSFEQGQIYRREFVAQSIAIQAKRDALMFPKTSC